MVLFSWLLKNFRHKPRRLEANEDALLRTNGVGEELEHL